ncbi:MAG: hypothetical protein RB191_08850 [Terriglobia bacterium]|nr:hypothetical protein [Terriglobia bacterium]
MDTAIAEVTELALIQLRSMPDWEAADILDSRLRVLETQYKKGFVERGLILVEMQERELWKRLRNQDGNPYTSFERWVCGSAPYSRRDCFAAMAAVKELRDIPTAQLAEVPRCNLALLAQLSTGVRAQPDVIEDAKTLSEKEFRAKIAVTFPNQHIEAQSKLEQALELAMRLEGLTSRRAAEDVVAEFYLAEHSDEEG